MVGLWLCPDTSWATEKVDSATRAAARKLGYEGIEYYQAEDYQAATERLERAYSMLRVPSLALWSARALQKSGQFVEAAERYLEATRLPADAGGDEEVQRRAREEAAQARDALLPRIPSLVIRIEGVEANSVRLTVRGEAVPSTVVGSARPTDPGTAVVAGQLGDQLIEEKVVLVEGEEKTVTLRFRPVAEAMAPTEAPPAETGPLDSGAPKRPWQRPVGWAVLGVGGAGLLAGGITGLIAITSQNPNCPGGLCDSSVDPGEIDSFNTLRTISTVGFVAGGVLAASGLTLLLTAPKSEHPVTATPFLGPHSVGLVGTF